MSTTTATASIKLDNLESIKESLEIMFRAYALSEICETDDSSKRGCITDDFLSLQKILRKLE